MPSSLLVLFVSLVLFLSHPQCGHAVETIVTTNREGVRLSYITGGTLDPAELKQVLFLARKAGITNVGEVSTHHYLPSLRKGITVKSKEWSNGRNITFDSISIYKSDWYGAKPDPGSESSGEFWMKPTDKHTTRQRTYEIGGATRRVVLAKGVDETLADKCIPLIAARKVRFQDDFARHRFERLDVLKPDSLRESTSGGYEVWYWEKQKVLHFAYENEEVVISAVGSFNH